MRRSLVVALLLAMGSIASAAERPPVYVWFEPEWFEGVEGSFNYWTGQVKTPGTWGIAGPGISAEFTQGGESEWNSMGAHAQETKARCHREFVVPRAGKYKVWVRYVDHRAKTEPFTVMLNQGEKTAVKGELGVQAAVPPNDEYQLYWGFSFAWASLDANLDAGPAKLTLAVTRPGDAWRQLDAVLITDDLGYVPVGREKPEFGYLKTIAVEPSADAKWRGEGSFESGASLKRIPLGGRDFAMWAGIDSDPKWWNAQKVDALGLYDILFQFGPPADIRTKFHEQFKGRRDLPILAW